VIDDAELRRMSQRDRAELMQSLAALDSPRLASRGSKRRRQLFLAGLIVCCVVLAVQIGVLAWTLPRYYRTGNWRGAWVGFDAALFCTFAVTAWAAWRGRQLLIMCLIVLATLLTADAWFDVTLDVRTSGFMVSLLSALLVELPLAVIAILGARRLLRLTIRQVMHREGAGGPVPPLWRIPLFGPGEGHLGRHPGEHDRDEKPAVSGA
jgi:cation transport ATPase